MIKDNMDGTITIDKETYSILHQKACEKKQNIFHLRQQ